MSRVFGVFGIIVIFLGCFVEDAHCQFGSVFPNNPPAERSGDNTVVCAVITRQCQIRCAERTRQGLPSEYVTWTVKILQTLVSCTTKDEKDITIGPSKSQVDIEFNVACCENQIKKQSDDDDIKIVPTPTIVASTTSPTTSPTTTTHPPANPPTMCESKINLSDEIENKLFISMLFSAVSTGMTIILCFMVLIFCWMFTNRRRSSRRKKEDVYNSPSFVYMRERNEEENSKHKDGMVTRASMASATELSSRPLPEVIQQNSRHVTKEPNSDEKPFYNKEKDDSENVRSLAFQPIDNNNMFGHINESFDSNPPPRRITFNNEARAESKLVSRLEKRHDSMPASSHVVMHKSTNTEACESFPEVNEDYEYCRLENDQAKKDQYSLINGRGKTTKRTGESMLQDNRSSSSDKELFNVIHPSLEKQSPSNGRLLRNKSMDYIDVETAYTKTMSPKTNKGRPNAIKDTVLPLLAHQSMKEKETAYEFADEITSQSGHATNQDTLPYDNTIDFHGKDGRQRKLVETEDL